MTAPAAFLALMKQRLIPSFLLAAALITGCDSSSQSGVDQAPPSAQEPSPAVREALQAQVIGSKLLGNTVRLAGDTFQAADLAFVPEAYFVYYSDSF